MSLFCNAISGTLTDKTAVLPLRGKILNVERAGRARVLGSNEIGIMISALGTGIHDDFNIEKLRYNKIIIMTSALQHVHSVVERRNTIPILSNVLIEAKEDGVYLTATDMDIAVIEKIDLKKSEVMQLGTINL